jgi:hypothetical protein
VEEVCETPVEEHLEEDHSAPARALASTTDLFLGMNTSDVGNEVTKDATSGYPVVGATQKGTATTKNMQTGSVQIVLNVHSLVFDKLSDDNAVDLAQKTKEAAAKYASVGVDEVLSVPEQGRISTSTRLIVQIFITGAEKDKLVAKIQQAKGKVFEAAMLAAINGLSLDAAKTSPGATVLVAAEKAMTGTETITFGAIIVADTTNKTENKPVVKPDTPQVTPTKAAPTKAPAKKITAIVTIKHLDFTKVMANAAVKNKLIADVKTVFLEKLNVNQKGYTAADLAVTLSQGSVKANVVITPKAGDEAASTTIVKEQQASIATATVAKVKLIAGVEDTLETGKKLDDLTAVSSYVASESTTKATTQAPQVIADFGLRATLQPVLLVMAAVLHVAQIL